VTASLKVPESTQHVAIYFAITSQYYWWHFNQIKSSAGLVTDYQIFRIWFLENWLLSGPVANGFEGSASQQAGCTQRG